MRSLLASVGFHCSLFLVAPALAVLLTPIPEVVPIRILRFEALRIRLPVKIYLAQPAHQPRTPQDPRSPSISAPGSEMSLALAKSFHAAPASQPAPATLGEVAVPAPPQARRRIELPPIRTQRSDFTLLQPDYPENSQVKPTVPTPQLLLWSAAPKVRRPLKDFVMPGAQELKPDARTLDAPPELRKPVNSSVSDLRFANAPPLANPSLPAPPAPSVPVRKFTPPPDRPKPASSIDPFAGVPLAVVSLPNRPLPFPDELSIPAGSILSRVTGPGESLASSESSGTGENPGADQMATSNRRAGDSAGRPDGAGAGVPGGTGAGLTASKSGSADGTGTASTKQPGSGTGGGTAVVASGGSGTGNRPGAEGGSSLSGSGAGNGASGTGILAGRAGPPIRIEHPLNDVFDVVVVGSSATMPQTIGVLSGSPVYTVFLKVGTPKSWIMQYCALEGKDAPAQKGSVILLSKPAPLKPPFPRISVTPPVVLLPSKDAITIHGTVSADGAFRDLRVLAGHQAARAADLLTLLDHWQFRPSTKDGRPVAIEVVLVVPPQSP